jgi:large subunit ribosomal protein L10
MPLNRSQKDAEIESLKSWISSGMLTVCADYRGLTVKQFDDLRGRLAASGSRGKVVKNTLARRSITQALAGATEAQMDSFQGSFVGPTFLVVSDDPVSSAKALSAFSKEHEKFQLKGAWFEGAYCEPEAIEALSKMPSKEELQATLLRLINTPATRVLQLANAPARQFVQLLSAYKSKMEEAA